MMCVIKCWGGSNEQTEEGLLADQRILSQNGQRGDSGKGSWSRALMDEQGLARQREKGTVGRGRRNRQAEGKPVQRSQVNRNIGFQWTTDMWQDSGRNVQKTVVRKPLSEQKQRNPELMGVLGRNQEGICPIGIRSLISEMEEARI